MHQIGVGVLGPVFRTYEPSEDRLVAVKAFHLDITPEQARTLIEALERLITTDVAHPGVVASLAVGLEDDVPYLAQEYVAAESLDVAIRHYSPASIETAMPFIRQMAAAVDAAHEGGIVHGALHLRDIFVTPDEARVTGFGVVRALEEIGLAGPIRRPYTAPEVIAGRGWGAAADRFALAAIVYELLTGRRAAGTGDQVTERIRSIEGVSDPEHLEEVFATAFADDPEDRYSSVDRFVSALEFGVGDERAAAVGAEAEVDRHGDTAPLDLLAGLELHHPDPAVEQTLDSVERLESTTVDDLIEGHAEVDDENETDDQTDAQMDWSVEDPVEFSVDSTRAERAGEDDGPELELGPDELSPDELSDDDDDHDEVVDDDDVAGDRADLEVITHPTVSDDRYVADGQEQDHIQDQEEEEDDDGDNTDYPDAMPVLPPPTEETHNPRSAWSRAIVPVLAIAFVVGSIAYFLGIVLAPRDGPTDQVLEPQSALNTADTTDTTDTADAADLVNRELSAALVGAGAGSPPVDAASGAPARSSNPVVAETPSEETARPVESPSETPLGTRPDPEPPRVSATPVAGSPEVEAARTRTVRVPSPGAMAAPVVPEAVPATGWVLVRTEPPGATVTLDGIGRGQTPVSLRDVSFGTHRLEVSRPGFDTLRREVTVNEQETVVPVGVSLTPAGGSPLATGAAAETGSLAIRSRPPGARVTVDGTSAGVTPLDVSLPVGRHQVRIEGDGYQAWVTSIEVTSSEPAQVNASLERPAR